MNHRKVINMEIDRVKISGMIRSLAKLDFINLKEKTTHIKETQTQYTTEKIREIDNDFKIYTSGDLVRIEVKRGKTIFLRNFIEENIDNQFDYNVNSTKGKLIISIQKSTINDTNFEELIKLMYLHTLM